MIYNQVNKKATQWFFFHSKYFPSIYYSREMLHKKLYLSYDMFDIYVFLKEKKLLYCDKSNSTKN